MALYEVRHTEIANKLMDDCIFYIAFQFGNSDAVTSLYHDIIETEERLKYSADSIKLCDDAYLAQKGYRKIKLKKHNYILIYQIIENMVFIEAMFHSLQDYENVFKSTI